MPFATGGGTVRWIASVRPAAHPSVITRDKHNAMAFDAVRDAIERDIPIVFSGRTGTGKTTLMLEIDRRTRDLTPPTRMTGRLPWLSEPNWWTCAPEYCADVERNKQYSRAFQDWSDEYSADGIARQARRLFVDDLGAELPTAPNVHLIAELIDRRHRADLPTWVTTNLSDTEIFERYGERTASRLFSRAEFIVLTGTDRRGVPSEAAAS